MGFGCGGAGQTDVTTGYLRGQVEQASVVSLEDPVPISLSGSQFIYLKEVANQTTSSLFFPGDGTTVFVVDLAESEISFAESTTLGSNLLVGTDVPISEAGLYLSTAKPGFTPELVPASVLESDPRENNYMVCYNTFSPIHITTGVNVRAEWELRF